MDELIDDNGRFPVMDSAFTQIPQQVPEHIKMYPEPAKMGIMPAYGFFIRHAKNIRLSNVNIHYLGAEVRPPFVLDQVEDVDFFRVNAQRVEGKPLMELSDVADVRMRGADDDDDADFWIEAESGKKVVW